MRVKEFRGEVVFMHEVVEGAAQKSWGVHVARLAGVPETIAKRAEMLLKLAERNLSATSPLPLFASLVEPVSASEEALRLRLAMLNPDAMTPREALDALYELRDDLNDDLNRDVMRKNAV
jgi:DNA mismatch repair protein MutS